MELKFKKMLDEIENKDSVISFHDTSMKVSQLFSIVKKVLHHKLFKNSLQEVTTPYNIFYDMSTWINGQPCEFLEPNKSWKKGKLKIKILLEFCSEESDEEESVEKIEKNESTSSLDDIRQTFNGN